MKYSLGIDIGASTIKAVIISEDDNIVWKYYDFHKGNLELAYRRFMESAEKIDAEDIMRNIAYVMISGSGAVAFELEDRYKANAMVAMCEGVELLFPDAASIINIGGQSAIYISGLAQKNNINFAMNQNCAAGTGAFFEDQMYRLGKKIEDYSDVIKEAKSIPRIAGRCSVFAKTDIIHRQQEGVPVEDILLGLSYAVVTNFKNTIVKNQKVEKPVAFIGGVSKNEGTKRAIKDIFNLGSDEFICSDYSVYAQAVGTAKCAIKENVFFNYRTLSIKKKEEKSSGLAPLKNDTDVSQMHTVYEINPDKVEDVYLGIDVGSTSTNLVLINSRQEIVDIQYLRTGGDSRKAVQKGLDSIHERLGDRIRICSTGVTGSGRYLIGNLLGAELIQDEITAQAKGAAHFCPNVDTIFEIGGQDSKFIRLENGRVVDFQMNRICAAGTGSFVEEQAQRLGIPISEYGKIALTSQSPIDLGERCTVFIETNINTALANEVRKEDIAAGLCYSIIRNYLHKVVGNKKIGKNICLQGGVAYNEGIVAAFKSVYGDSVSVTPYFSVTGAVGAALLSMASEKGREFVYQLPDRLEKKQEVVSKEVEHHLEQYKKSYDWFLSGYQDKSEEQIEAARKAGKPIVGVPRALMIYRLFPMAYNFLKGLGCEVVLSKDTDEDIIKKGQQYTKEETCYPIKLLHGHMAELMERKVDYIFMPSVLTIKHAHTNIKHNYGCVYMQSAPRIVAKAIGLENTGIKLLNPVLNLDMGKPAMVKEMVKIGMSLGKTAPACAKAMVKAGAALAKYSEDAEKMGREILAEIKEDEKVFVLITRNYGISDRTLSMGIAETLINMGYQVITLAHLPGHSIDLSDEYPNLYWPFSQHILSGAKLIKDNPNLYAIYLTNHGCGPDAMISHLFADIMGDKPYLSLEVDEHYSKVGVITKLEAFVSSLKDKRQSDAASKEDAVRVSRNRIITSMEAVDKDKKLYIPSLYPYGNIAVAGLRRLGYNACLLPEIDENILSRGRSYTRMKEYETFTAIIGSVVSLEEKEDEKHQIFIWQTQGAEADGFYPMLVENYLKNVGNDRADIVAPMQELVYQNEYWAEFLLKTLVLGDLVMMYDCKLRHSKLDMILEECGKREIAWGEIKDLALDARHHDIDDGRIRLGIVGDPECIFQDALNNGVLTKLENRGYRLERILYSEYMVSMWEDECMNHGEGDVKNIVKRLCEIQMVTGKERYSDLKPYKENKLRHVTGTNIQYRMAKQIQGGRKIAGQIIVSSAYENVSTIINLAAPETDIPSLTMAFDGNKNEDDELRVAAFLKIVENNCLLDDIEKIS